MMLQSSVFKRSACLESGGFLETLRYRDDTHLFLKLGIGAAVCAVNGCGVKMTADDDPSNRLSLNYNNERQGYWMQVLMFQDLLGGAVNLNLTERRILRLRLAGAYRSMARLAWREHRLLTAVWWSGKSAFTAPGMFFNRFGRRISRKPRTGISVQTSRE